MTDEQAQAAALRVIDNLLGRAQFDWWWDEIDPGVKAEILESLAKSIQG